MNYWFYTVWMALTGNFEQYMTAVSEYRRVETEIYRSRFGKKFMTTPEERRRLLEAGLPLGDGIKDVITIVQPETFQRWVRNAKRGNGEESYVKRGRPRIGECIRDLIVRLARENIRWGYTRIQGETLKLGRRVGRSTVSRILGSAGIPDAPNRSHDTWRKFLRRHKETLWATDFGSKTVLSFSGLRVIYFLFFIHTGSRRVYYAGCTEHPKASWVEQQARNFSMHLQDRGESARYILRDRDRKYTAKFDAILKSEGIKPVRLPVRAPNLNSYAESWLGSLKRECLNHFIVFGERHLNYLIREYLAYYHHERPHQSLGNKTIIPCPVRNEGEIRCKTRLGGLLNHYYRDAA